MRMTVGELRQVIREEVARSLREGGGSVYDNSGRGPNPSARPHGLPNDEDMGLSPRRAARGGRRNGGSGVPTKSQVAAEIGMDPSGVKKINVLDDGTIHVVTVDSEYEKAPGDRFREIY